MSIEQDYIQFNKLLFPILKEQLQVNKKYLSPIPRNGHYETSGSFSVFEGAEKYKDALFWKDWGLSEQKGSRPEHLAMHLLGISYEEAESLLEGEETIEATEIPRKKRRKLQIFDRDNLTQPEVLYWLSYGITEDTLRLFNVRGVDKLMAGRNTIYEYSDERPTFSYRGGEDLEHFQWYSPKPKDFLRKGSFILGWNQLPSLGDHLLIVSGMKDGLCFLEATGIPFLAGSGEASWRGFKPHLKNLQKRFRNVRTLLDPDPAGRLASETFKKELDILPLNFPYPDLRDIADLSKELGREWLATKIFNCL